MLESRVPLLALLLESIAARTHEGRVKWGWDQLSRKGLATLETGYVEVSKDSDNDTVVIIMDEEQSILETLNVGFRDFSELKKQADSLYELGRRSALQIDSKLQSMLEELGT